MSLTRRASTHDLGEPDAVRGVEVEEHLQVRACRSGLSAREYQVFMSMQPMFAIQTSASSSFTSG